MESGQFVISTVVVIIGLFQRQLATGQPLARLPTGLVPSPQCSWPGETKNL